MEADVLLNVYIDLNLLLAVGAAIWLIVRRGLARAGLGQAFRRQLRLFNGFALAVAVSPVLILVLTRWSASRPPTLSDIMVSQYLQGNVGMSASKFQALIGLRDEAVRQIAGQSALWTQILAAAFAVGAVFCIWQVAHSVWRLRGVLRRSYVWKRIGRVRVLVSDTTRIAFSTRGLRYRYVVLPSSLLTSPEDLRLIVGHELQHFRQRDVEFEILMEFLRPLLFWNPAFYVWRNEMRLLREYACDQAMLARTPFQARAYCECLIRAAALAAQERVFFTRKSPAVALVDRRELKKDSALRRRVSAVVSAGGRDGHTGSWLLIGGLLFALVLVSGAALQRPSDWSHDRIMLSTIVNLERMANRSAAVQSAFQGGFVTAD